MRPFNDFEKKIIRQLVEIDLAKSNVLDFITNSVLFNRGLEIKQKEKTITIWVKKGDEINAASELFELISLLQYLEKNYLIFVHINPHPFPGNFVSKNLTERELHEKVAEFATLPIPTTIYDIITSYRNSFLVIGTEMKILVENSFKTTEQIFHETELLESKRQTRISRNSFFIALVALFFSLIAPFLFNTTINKEQIKEIKQEIRTLDQTIKNQRKI
jgi:hypothetical protein